MIATNVTILDLEHAAAYADVVLNEVRWMSSKRVRFTLRPTAYKNREGNHKWQRTSASAFHDSRRVFAVCWHGHRAFLDALFARRPDAIVRSALGGRKVVHRGSVDLTTAWIPLGAPINGGYPTAASACICPYAGTEGPEYYGGASAYAGALGI